MRAQPPPAAPRERGSAGKFPTVTRTRFAEHAYTALFHKIITGEIPEGGMLPSENELTALFGLSRPVVREALERLRAEGLIASRRGSGSYVQPRTQLSLSSAYIAGKQRLLLDNLEFRKVIEPEAAYFAAERRTRQDLAAIQTAIDRYEEVAVRGGSVGDHLDYGFHLAVAMACRNRRFVDAIQTVEFDIDHGVNLVRYLVRFDHLERSRSVFADHSRIFQAIRDERPDEARIAMRVHLEHARLRMVQSRPLVALPQ